jgi:hypothetical protein
MTTDRTTNGHFESALDHVERLIGSQEMLRSGITEALAVARTAEQREVSVLELRGCDLVLNQARLVRDELRSGLCCVGHAVV